MAAWNSTGSESPTRIRPRPGVRRGTPVAPPVPINVTDSRSSDRRSATRSPIAGALAKSSTSDGCSVATIRWMPSRWPSEAISSNDETSCGCSDRDGGRLVDHDDEPRQGDSAPCPLVAAEQLGVQRTYGVRSARWASETSWCITTCGSEAHAANVDRPARSRSANVSAPGGRPAASPDHHRPQHLALAGAGCSADEDVRSVAFEVDLDGSPVRHADRDAGMGPLGRCSPAGGERRGAEVGRAEQPREGNRHRQRARCRYQEFGIVEAAPIAAPSPPRWRSRGGTAGRRRPSSVHATTRRVPDHQAVR